MPKITLTTLGSRYGSIDALNANFEAIEEAFDNTFSRDGTGPNTFEADVDANSFRIINLPIPLADDEAATKGYVDVATAAIEGYLEDIGIVADNIDAVVTVSGVAETLTDNMEDIVDVATNISNVNAVAGNIGSVELVGLDLNGQFQANVIYDFGLITEEPVGPAPESDSSIVIVATNITDVNTVADNIVAIQEAEANADAAAASAVAALAAQTAAELAETHAETAEANAETAETNAEAAQAAAEVAKGLAETAATSAQGYASTATTKAGEASDSAADAVTAQLAAEAALASTLAAYDSFDDRYLGAKASDPSVDNDGNALVAGALYFLTGSGMKIWTGSSWEFAYVPGGTYLAKANNLSDLTNAGTARTNLGLGTAATTNATAYATAAQGALADTAFQQASAGDLATLDTVGTSYITNNAVTVDKLAASLDYGSIA